MIETSYFNILLKDSTSMDCYVATHEGVGPRPGIIVLQEAYGVNHHIRNITERLANEGFLAIAPELFHRTAPKGFEAPYGDMPAVMPHMQALTEDTLAVDMDGAFDWLKSRSNVGKIAAIGFCLGGRAAFIANLKLPLAAAVSFYGGGISKFVDRVSKLHAAQLLVWGGLDKHIPHEQIEAIVAALKAANKPYVNAEFSYADHGFNCDERASYNPEAAREAWALAMAFIKNRV